MLSKLLPILLALVGVGGGIGAGLVLKPGPEELRTPVIQDQAGDEVAHGANPDDIHGDDQGYGHDHGHAQAAQEYVKLNNQFVIPVVGEAVVNSLVALSLSIEVEPGQTETVYQREPKLRDAFLQVLFDHANMGGFGGEFTNANNMDVLRGSLREAAQAVIGKAVRNVLITDIARQDV